MDFQVTVGMSTECNWKVDHTDTALHFGSGTVSVLATPVMIGWMENAALNLVKDVLPKGYDTVGTLVNVSHIAATPVGMRVRVIAEVTEVNGKALTFSVKAYDEVDKIGEGIHKRAIVEVDKFVNRTNAKKS